MILDAAASLLREVGPDGITVKQLADRAETSKGSLYHFFPDVPAVLRALADRHLAEIGVITESIARDESIAWQTVPTREVVRYVLAPLDYLEQNPDLMALIRAPGVLPRTGRSMQPMLDFVDRVLGARFPSMSKPRRAARAAMIVAVIDGAVATVTRGRTDTSGELRRELEELLTVYLDSLD